jgi:hypothetical protein
VCVSRAVHCPRRSRPGRAGGAFAPILAISGLAFPLHSSQLYAVLYLTLPLLLAWVAALTVVTARRPARAQAGAAAA